VDVAFVSALALPGVLIEPLPGHVLAAVFAAAAVFALILDQVKLRVQSMFKLQEAG
jgi:hypothetical protein